MVLLTVTNRSPNPVVINAKLSLAASARRGATVSVHVTGAELDALAPTLTSLKSKGIVTFAVGVDPSIDPLLEPAAGTVDAAAEAGLLFGWAPNATAPLPANVYSDWPSLYAAVNAVPRGRRRVVLTDVESAYDSYGYKNYYIPAGNWDLNGWIFEGSGLTLVDVLYFSNGAHIVPVLASSLDSFQIETRRLTLTWENTDSPVFDMGPPTSTGSGWCVWSFVDTIVYGTWNVTPTQPLMKNSLVSGTKGPTINAEGITSLMGPSATTGVLDTAAGSISTVFASVMQGQIGTNGGTFVTGAGTVQLGFGPMAAYTAPTNFTGTISPTLYGLASMTKFVPGTSTLTSTDSNAAMVELSGRTLKLGAKQTGAFNAAVGYRYPVDLTTTAITGKMPGGTHTAGDKIGFGDAMGAAATHNLTIDFTTNSQKLNGASANYVINTNGGRVVFVYVDATVGWMQE